MQPDLLSQLHDIQLPEQVSWWPLAWGWYLVIFLVLALLYFTIQLATRHRKRHRAKRQALKLLAKATELATPAARAKHINEVLKRAVLAYGQRNEVAELSGQRWADWLNSRSDKGPIIEAQLVNLAYRPDCAPEHAEQYLLQATKWIQDCLPLKTLPLKAEQSKGAGHV